MSRLVYNDELHRYTLDGRVIPSVTTIIHPLSAELYKFVDKDVMMKAAALGTAVHKVIELDIKGTLDLESLHDDIVPYYSAWLHFVSLSGFKMLASECRVHSDRYVYAGTLDLVGTLPTSTGGIEYVIIDAKRCASVPRTAGPQTAGYEMALRENPPEGVVIPPGAPIKRYALHLKTNGSYALVPFTDKGDARVFLSCLSIHSWSKAA